MGSHYHNITCNIGCKLEPEDDGPDLGWWMDNTDPRKSDVLTLCESDKIGTAEKYKEEGI